MDCPCYRAIYSTTVDLPEVIVLIISDYGHIISDNDIIHILDGSHKNASMYLTVDINCDITCLIGDCDIRRSLAELKLSCRFTNSNKPDVNARGHGKYTGTFKYVDVFGFGHFNGDIFEYVHIKIDSPQWDSILDYIGPRRNEIWHAMYPNDPPAPEFIFWCDTFIEIFTREVRKYTPVCPWNNNSA